MKTIFCCLFSVDFFGGAAHGSSVEIWGAFHLRLISTGGRTGRLSWIGRKVLYCSPPHHSWKLHYETQRCLPPPLSEVSKIHKFINSLQHKNSLLHRRINKPTILSSLGNFFFEFFLLVIFSVYKQRILCELFEFFLFVILSVLSFCL